ncbi:MAG: hypothetical protein RIT45_4244 [Pseudomonadota bacterium]|jgi:chemotaxis protein MotB
MPAQSHALRSSIPPTRWLIATLLLAAVAPGCTAVARDAYDRDMAAMRQQTDWLEAQKKRLAAESESWQQKHAAAIEELSVCKKNRSDLEDELTSCQQKLDALARNSGQCGELLRQCESEKNKIRADLMAERDKNARLANKLDAIARQLQAMRDSIAKVRGKLADLVRAGKLRVEVKNGFLVIGLESDILFATGKSDLRAEARPVLLELAEVLRQFSGKRFQVAGHTDRRGGDDVNWRLSVDRALSVVQFMIRSGKVPAKMLSAGGYAHYLPNATDDDEEGWKQNRRVEFLLMPDLTELYNLADPGTGDSDD